ncbi:MAG: AAA family ATPase [Planctomycetota bacterium]|nr:AAA family ATPase [Planctomycetota bacterium]
MRRIAIINQKGGVGKTTTVANLGAALARAGKRVVVFDMDPQANLSLYLGSEVGRGDASVYGVLTEGLPVQLALRKTKTPGLYLVASHLDLSGAELELASTMSRETLLRDAINLWEAEALEKDGFPPVDYILLDCPPSLGLLSINALVAAEEVMIAVQTEFFALQGLSKLVEVIQLLRRRMNPALTLTGILPCLYDSRLKLAREVLAELRRFFPGKVYPTPVRTNVRLAESPSHGMTIFEYAPGSNGAKDYEAMGRELLQRSPTEERPMPSQVEVVNDDQAKELHRAAEGLRELEAPAPDHWPTDSDAAPTEASNDSDGTPPIPEVAAKTPVSEAKGEPAQPEISQAQPSQTEPTHNEVGTDSSPFEAESDPIESQETPADGSQNADCEPSDLEALEKNSDSVSIEPTTIESEQAPLRQTDGVDAELAIYELPRTKVATSTETPTEPSSESLPVTEIPTSNPLTGALNEVSEPAPLEAPTATLEAGDHEEIAPTIEVDPIVEEEETTSNAALESEVVEAEEAGVEPQEAEPEKPNPTPVMGFANYIGEDRWTRKPQQQSGG